MCMSAHIYIQIYIYVYIQICVYMYVCVYIYIYICIYKEVYAYIVVKTPPANAVDSQVGKLAWRRKGQPIQYSCLDNSMDRGAWQTAVMGSHRGRHN